QQIKLLSDQLPKGFSNARPDQDIIFVLEKNESGFLGLDESSFIAGRMFFKEGRLNLIIGEYEFFRSKAFESFYDGSGRQAVPYTFNFGSRTRDSKNFDEIFINLPGIENKKANKIRHDWFVIDLKVAAKAYVNRENRGTESIQDKKLEAEAAKLARERRLMRAEMARMRKEMQEGNNGGASAKSIEERIATLEQLLDKELITKEEYDTKRKEILNDI
ncbi:MAG: SHOCT domain-containing protein, partial [Proteobacteria bacterium]|nr:SHOCT domain-containing protein [Pseudomonadota bacterium]